MTGNALAILLPFLVIAGATTYGLDGMAATQITQSRRRSLRPSDISGSRLDALSDGAPTTNLMEQIALDQERLLKTLIPGHFLTTSHLGLRSPRLSERMWAGGQVLLDVFDDDALDQALAWESDTARAWGAMAVGLLDDLPLEYRLELIKPFAADEHFAVREWAWIALRDRFALELEKAISELSSWVVSDDERLRRFASEGTRPRGVWCRHLPRLKDCPQLALPILEPLQSDAARYVQLSVGNWLNDASKTRPEWVEQICERWLSQNPGATSTERICRRGLRSLRSSSR